MIKKIIGYFKNEAFDELAKFVSDIETETLANEIKNIDKDLMVLIVSKFPDDIFADLFMILPLEIQDYLVENINDIVFKKFSEKLLDHEDIENKIDKEIFNKILIRAEVESRKEKLLEIIDNIENKKFANLKPILSEMKPIDIAEIINNVDEEKVAVVFRVLPKNLASDVFVELDNDAQQIVIKAFTDTELSHIINDMFLDDTADIIEEMPSNIARRILKVSKKENREIINKLLGFPKDSAGSIMTPECITLRETMTVDDALTKIRKQALDKETIYTCYVTDDNKQLLGTVSARDILIHSPEEKIGDFMQDNFIFASATTDREEVAHLLSKYNLLAIPIVDKENRILGIVTIDDAIDVITEEATEDITKIAGAAPSEKPYLKTNPLTLWLNRIPWLIFLLLSATFTGLVISKNEALLSNGIYGIILTSCMPMIMGTGGNAGGQASATIIRGIALNEVEFKDTPKVIWKELRVGIVMGLSLGIICFGKIMLIDGLLLKTAGATLITALTISLSLCITLIFAKLIGAVLPLIAKKCKLDPAVMASPFITTLIDIISLIIYCNFALLFLG